MSSAASLLAEYWQPHDGQVPVGRALFHDGFKDIFVQAGRKWGKTELIMYCLWRWGLENPGSENYYFAPFAKQAREIIWASRRLQNLGPKDLVEGKPSEVEMRLRLANGSFIKADGSENFEAYRGITPSGLIIYDEFKDFRPEFHEAFDPNRAMYDCPLIMIGTPPDRHCQYVELAEQSRNSSTAFFTLQPTKNNPYISRDWLEAKKKELYDRGEGDVYEREYNAKYVKGGAARIFPMLTDEVIKPHEEIMRSIERDMRKLHWILFADPASASCFAVIFMAVNPYTKMVYLLDEIYETDQGEMTVTRIGTRIFQKRDELYEREWRQGYDEAETWFCQEMIERFPDDDGFEPSHKAMNKKDVGLSLMKDILLKGKLVASDRCKKAFWEMDNYYKDKNGKIPKKDDHLIDCIRYSLAALGYVLETEEEYLEKHDPDFRGERLYVGNDIDGYRAI